MENLDDKPSCQEPGYFLSDGLPSLLIKTAKKLFDLFELRINIKTVLSEFPRYTWHVRRFPCKDVPVLTNELEQRAFLFWIQVNADAKLLG